MYLSGCSGDVFSCRSRPLQSNQITVITDRKFYLVPQLKRMHYSIYCYIPPPRLKEKLDWQFFANRNWTVRMAAALPLTARDRHVRIYDCGKGNNNWYSTPTNVQRCMSQMKEQKEKQRTKQHKKEFISPISISAPLAVWPCSLHGSVGRTGSASRTLRRWSSKRTRSSALE